jgi:hypothetical protein
MSDWADKRWAKIKAFRDAHRNNHGLNDEVNTDEICNS